MSVVDRETSQGMVLATLLFDQASRQLSASHERLADFSLTPPQRIRNWDVCTSGSQDVADQFVLSRASVYAFNNGKFGLALGKLVHGVESSDSGLPTFEFGYSRSSYVDSHFLLERIQNFFGYYEREVGSAGRIQQRADGTFYFDYIESDVALIKAGLATDELVLRYLASFNQVVTDMESHFTA